MRDFVSIITPVYNGERFLEEMILSVVNQIHEHWELIIINDCSIDKTQAIAEKYKALDKRIRIINLEHNSGIATARNLGIKSSKGDYVAFLDSDDLWKPNKLITQLTFMKKKNVLFTFSDYELIDNNGQKMDKIIKSPLKIDYKQLLKGNAIGCLTVMIDKRIGTIEMPLLHHEDYATWLSLLKRGYNAFGIQENLAMYRKTDGSISSNKLKTITWTWRIYRKSMQLNFFASIKYIVYFIINTTIKYLRK
ncbi:glycosyltransferase family 2 protein [Paenibacillus sp. 22594]|uniref:glycosyltransferase family 2 protein n=1 Tax=Paenibacillus sp. 22594 TaxID=3453947 RepID=UPI003F868AB3